MLDLVFLVFLLITLFFAFRGAYKETLCNIAMVVGILAAVIGFVVMFLRSPFGNSIPVFLRVFELVFAFSLRFITRHIVKLYDDRIAENERKIQETLSRYTREAPDAKPPVYDDNNFDDPELRFGKGGYTDNKL